MSYSLSSERIPSGHREILKAKIELREPKSPYDAEIQAEIKKAQTEAAKAPAESPQWVPDSHCNACMICETGFTFIRRKHHCRKCGKVVCHDCAPNNNTRPILEWKITDPVRHCKQCYKSPAVEWK